MKRVVYTLCVLGLFSCTNDNLKRTDESSRVQERKKSSVLANKGDETKEEGKAYTQQLPYVDANHDFLSFNVKNKLNEKMNDPKVTWEEIDKLYHDNLNPAEKQFLIYIMLAKKDLIGLQKEKPSNEQFAKLSKYTQELVNSKYIGYCLLYNALITLDNGDNSDIIQSYAKKIEDYSANESFHSNFLKKPKEKGAYIEKVSENYSFLDKIKKL